MSETKRTLKDLIPVSLVIQATQEARDIVEGHIFFEPPDVLERVNQLLHRLDDEVPMLPGGFDKAQAILCEAAGGDPQEVIRHASIPLKDLPVFSAIFFNGLTKPGPLQNGDLLVLLDPTSGVCMKHDGTVVAEQIIELPKKLGRLATIQEIFCRLSGISMSDSVAAALEEIANEPLPGDTLETIPAPAPSYSPEMVQPSTPNGFVFSAFGEPQPPAPASTRDPVEQVFPPFYAIFPFGENGKDLAESHRAEIEAKAVHSGKVDLFRGSWSVMIPAISKGDAEVILAKVDNWSGMVRPNQFEPPPPCQPTAAIVEMPPSSDFGPKPPVEPPGIKAASLSDPEAKAVDEDEPGERTCVWYPCDSEEDAVAALNYIDHLTVFGGLGKVCTVDGGPWGVLIDAGSRFMAGRVRSAIGEATSLNLGQLIANPIQPLAPVAAVPPAVAPALSDEEKAFVADHAAMTGMSIADAAKDLGFDTGLKKSDMLF